VASGYPGLSYQWRRGGVELSDGPTPQGSVLAGAHDATLNIQNVQNQDAGGYDCVITHPCAVLTTLTATLSVCYANCDGSTSLPTLAINDFVCFQAAFAAGDPYANCDHSTGSP